MAVDRLAALVAMGTHVAHEDHKTIFDAGNLALARVSTGLTFTAISDVSLILGHACRARVRATETTGLVIASPRSLRIS